MTTQLGENHRLTEILQQFPIAFDTIAAYGSGLINSTWKVSGKEGNFILQKINQHVFKRPQDIDHNIVLLDTYIKKHHPEYFFVSPVKTRNGESIYQYQDGDWYRLLPFVENSQTIDVVQTPEQAYEAASQFGRFTRVLAGIQADELRTTIPDFHNLALRHQQFLTAIKNGDASRIKESSALIAALSEHTDIVQQYNDRIANPEFKIRVTHHDTKISNILFDQSFKGICVIDLDTVMPGYFFSDVGDMMRTYLSPVSEEEKDFTKIEVRKDFYEAIVKGYKDEMANELTDDELNSFIFAGRFMIYMQALRFLTDHLNNDIYYGAKYEGHNFVRAGNQLQLLKQMTALSA